jgi:nitrogen fixation NifU-like protein
VSYDDDERDRFMELLWDHSRENSPLRRVYGVPKPPVFTATGDGLPTCDDKVTLWLGVGDGTITWARHGGYGCAVSQAAASLLCLHVQGAELGAALTLAARAIEAAEQGDGAGLPPDLALFFNKISLAKRKCARLAWRVMVDAARGASC